MAHTNKHAIKKKKIKVLPLGSNQEKLMSKGRKSIFGRFLKGMAKIIYELVWSNLGHLEDFWRMK